MFREAKTAQMAAYLLQRSGGRMNYTKLMKLLYLADRESMRQTGDSMTHDLFFSLNHGPVLSRTLDMIREVPGAAWSQLIERDGRYDVALTECARALGEEDLDELSPANCETLEGLHKQFAPMTWQQVVEWTHQHCPEWRDPQGSNHPITAEDMFKAFGFNDEKAHSLSIAYEDRRQLDRVMDCYK